MFSSKLKKLIESRVEEKKVHYSNRFFSAITNQEEKSREEADIKITSNEVYCEEKKEKSK